MADAKVYTFRDPQPLARATVIALYVYLASVIGMGLGAFLTFVEAGNADGSLSKDTLLPSTAPAALFSLLYFLAYAVAGFLILKWIYRTSRNAHSAAAGLPISPPWSVGWYFVPFANLWKPFQALRQTWQVSTDPADWAAVGTPRRLRWWWGLLLTTAILSQLSLRVSQMGKTLVATTASALIDLVGLIPEVALALTLIAVVRELTQLQMTNLVKPNGRPPTTIPLVS